MQIKSDSRGITMLELVIAVALLTAVLFSAYFFLDFTKSSLEDTQAQFDAGTDARLVFLNMEKNIRNAKDVIIDEAGHSGVEVIDGGNTLNVYTDINNDDKQEFVQYKLINNSLKWGECELGGTPVLNLLVDKVKNDALTPKVPVFTQSGKQIIITLIVLDENDYLENDPMTVSTSITMRN
jgi:hypothetical protein